MKRSNRMMLRGRALMLLILFTVAFPLSLVAASQSESALADMSEEKLKAVASAYIKVFEIRENYEPLIENAGTAEEANQLQQAANQEMLDVIANEENVTVDEYNNVIREIGNDEELRTRLQAHVDEILEEESQ